MTNDMKKISGNTFLYKKAYPAIFIIAAAGIVYIGLKDMNVSPFVIVGAMVLNAIVFFTLYRQFFLPMVDTVYDCGDSLLVQNSGQDVRVPLSDVVNLSFQHSVIVLDVRTDTPFGKKIKFAAPNQHIVSTEHPVIVELLPRIDQARGSK
ncbi:MAG: hypothetical protein KDI90_09330 [Alphaproteobacteria bacterium]|nr:hypothetical protein [Alphaproteobacteria bacterium]